MPLANVRGAAMPYESGGKAARFAAIFADFSWTGAH
jgi:hypothetical protein